MAKTPRRVLDYGCNCFPLHMMGYSYAALLYINREANTLLFMPPKELRWHIKIEPSVRPSVRQSVRPSVTNRVSAISHKLLKQI